MMQSEQKTRLDSTLARLDSMQAKRDADPGHKHKFVAELRSEHCRICGKFRGNSVHNV